MSIQKADILLIPEISIIVSSYNVERYIEQAVNSILDGITVQNYEIIIVDDGSTDGTRQIIERIAKAFDEVRIIQFEENTPGGVGRAANVGIDAARGAFIGFLDGDDIALPGTYDRLLSEIKTEETDVVLCNYERWRAGESGPHESEDQKIWQVISQQKNYTGEEVKELLKLQVYPWRKLYRASFLKADDLKFPEVDSYFEDSLFHWRVLLAAKSATVCNFVGFYYRVARVGQTISMGGGVRMQALLYVPEIKELVRQNNSKRCNDAFLGWYLNVLSWITPLDPSYIPEIQRNVSETLNEYSILRIAEMLRGVPSKRRIFPPLARTFSAIIWLRLGVPYMFRKKMLKKPVTLFEALAIRSLILVSSLK